MNDKLISLKDVSEYIGLSHATIWHLRKRGDFPPVYSLTGPRGKKGVKQSELNAWLAKRVDKAVAVDVQKD